MLFLSCLHVFILFPLLLLLYQMCFFQQCFDCCEVRWHALHIFIDAFQGCFKDGTYGSWDCWYFQTPCFYFPIKSNSPAIEESSNWGQSGDWTDSHAGLPLNLDWIWALAHHTPSVCMFSWRQECQMPVWGHQSGLWISLNPIPSHTKGANPPPSGTPKVCLVGCAHRNLTKCLCLWPKIWS